MKEIKFLWFMSRKNLRLNGFLICVIFILCVVGEICFLFIYVVCDEKSLILFNGEKVKVEGISDVEIEFNNG